MTVELVAPLYFDASRQPDSGGRHDARILDQAGQTPAALIESRRRATVIDHADELTALDQAIGDGDHGANMKRGFEAVLADLDTLAAQAAAGGAEGGRHARS